MPVGMFTLSSRYLPFCILRRSIKLLLLLNSDQTASTLSPENLSDTSLPTHTNHFSRELKSRTADNEHANKNITARRSHHGSGRRGGLLGENTYLQPKEKLSRDGDQGNGTEGAGVSEEDTPQGGTRCCRDDERASTGGEGKRR